MYRNVANVPFCSCTTHKRQSQKAATPTTLLGCRRGFCCNFHTLLSPQPSYRISRSLTSSLRLRLDSKMMRVNLVAIKSAPIRRRQSSKEMFVVWLYFIGSGFVPRSTRKKGVKDSQAYKITYFCLGFLAQYNFKLYY